MGKEILGQKSELETEQFDRHQKLFNDIWREPWEVIRKGMDRLKETETETVEFLDACPIFIRVNYHYPVLPEDLNIPIPLGATYLNVEAGFETLFTMYVFGDKTTGVEHVALLKGVGVGVGDGKNVPIRVHSSCITAETFHASNCDCHEQLEMSLQIADTEDNGGAIWLYQEGRGNGLLAKTRQLKIMLEEGVDTVSAFEKAGYVGDRRDFKPAADMLKILGIESIRLITNNPEKVNQMRDNGINVVDRIPCIVPPFNEILRRDMEAKRVKLGHII